jgi:hypothetical protein
MMIDIDQPIAQTVPKSTRRRTTKADHSITYDIVNDVLHTKANIDLGDLLVASPRLKKQFLAACRQKGRNKVNPEQTIAAEKEKLNKKRKISLTFLENNGDVDTTAMYYSTFYIGQNSIPVIIDTGAARTCMSHELAENSD